MDSDVVAPVSSSVAALTSSTGNTVHPSASLSTPPPTATAPAPPSNSTPVSTSDTSASPTNLASSISCVIPDDEASTADPETGAPGSGSPVPHDDEGCAVERALRLLKGDPCTLPWSYENQVMMAPMVRVSTLPMRLLARVYGCTMVFTEELIAKKVRHCTKRVVDETLGTINYYQKDASAKQAPVFVTYPNERVEFQMGAANAVEALEAASIVARDVRAINLNMGCPEHFSIQGGMGASLLGRPEVVKDIVSTLKRNLSLPITVKIRLLDEPSETLQLCQIAEKCGASAICVHARRAPDRPRHKACPDHIPFLVSSLSIPLVYNGDVFQRSDIQRLKAESGASSIMIARGAQWNASIFRAKGMLPVYDVASDYMAICQAVGNRFANSKYVLLEMIKGHVGPLDDYQTVVRSKTFDTIRSNMKLLRSQPCMSGPYIVPFGGFQLRTDLPSYEAFIANASLQAGGRGKSKQSKKQKKEARKQGKKDKKRRERQNRQRHTVCEREREKERERSGPHASPNVVPAALTLPTPTPSAASATTTDTHSTSPLYPTSPERMHRSTASAEADSDLKRRKLGA